MNNTQLYLSIGIPSFLVMLSWLAGSMQSNRNTDKLNDRIDRLDGKIERQGESLRAEIERQAESLRAEMNGLRKEIYASMVPLHERMAVLETKQK